MRLFFAPAGAAIVGASRDPAKPGHQILRSMLEAGFPPDRLYPINPRETEVAGLPAYPDLASVPGRLELAVLMVPEAVLDRVLDDATVRATARGDLGALIVASGGFAETGTVTGRDRQDRLVRLARSAGLRVMGPNCVGVIDNHHRLDTTFLHGVVRRPGPISFVSQSGAVGAWLTQMLSSEPEPVGFAKLISLGNSADVSVAETLAFLRDDPHTGVVGLYLEGTAEPRSLLRALSALAAEKPVVVLKTGRSETGRQAATSHTGALAGSDRMWAGALRQAGVVRADGVDEFVDTLRVLAAHGSRRRAAGGPLRVFVVTHAGGPGVYTMDLLDRHRAWLEPARVAPATRVRLEAVVPPFSSVCRPEGHLDMTAAATAEQHAEVTVRLMDDPAVDALVTLDLPTRFLDDTEVAEALIRAWNEHNIGVKPGPVFLPVIMYGRWSAEGRSLLERSGLPALATPDRAVAALAGLARHLELTAGLVATGPAEFPLSDPEAGEKPGATACEASRVGAGAASPVTLCEVESADLLAVTGVSFARSRLVGTPEAAVAAADELGYPVVVKLCSRQVPHKVAAGVVRLGLTGADGLRRAVGEVAERAGDLFGRADWLEAAGAEDPRRGFLVQEQARPGRECIIGGLRDPLFGPVIALGQGGTRVGQERPLLFRLAPLTSGQARALVDELLAEWEDGRDCDLDALTGIILGLSRLLVQRPDVIEVDLNPVLLYPRGAVAVDALVRLER